jgi:hypothetical protein
MACITLNAGIPAGCESNSGGVKKIWITDYANVVKIEELGGVVSDIELESNTSFYEFAFNKETSSFTENTVVNVQNGSIFYDQTVSLVLARREVAKRNVLKMMAMRDLAVIVLDSNGLYWLIGKGEGAMITETQSQTGVTKEDANGYTITITAKETAPAPEIDKDIIDGLV